ncbi:hypothetical protein [Adlercreutzia sp. ZJ141]|uniref:hypothetical protein n=1 Tax=Adlercreutzia sp. ZJ141 TaxID=2709406 RepID=UPI0013EB6B4E|nr:hypothetical protein [Adlercreutzia sp. ZJ141]
MGYTEAMGARGVRGRASAVTGLLAAVLAFCAVCMAVVLVPGAACADEYQGRTDWMVTFTPDKQMVHSPENMNFTDAVSDMQPGDVSTVAVTIKNEHAATTDWYMTNEVIRSLEESVKVAHSSGYGYVLTYKGPSGQEKTLFNSDEVGGDEYGSSGEGLNEATSSLEDFLYLDTLKSGEQGLVTLQVSLDGETNNNAYQDTLADIKMNFAVELTPESPGSPAPGGPIGSSLPQTGDQLGKLLLFALVAAGGAVLLLLALLGRRLRREQEAAGDVTGVPAGKAARGVAGRAAGKDGKHARR